MKNFKYLSLFSILVLGIFLIYNYNQVDYDQVRLKHSEFLKNSPFKETKNLPKDQRKKMELPPNAYAERMWELSMNPYTGRTEPEKLFRLQKELREKNDPQNRIAGVPGEPNNDETKWVHRGPYNVGGRTKAMMWDPNDPTNETVFAGGVSGGIFKNISISNPNSPWTLVDENMPQNLAVSSITYDPNDTNIFYAGTGEIYTGGDAIGNGLWKSIDGGVTWQNIFGGSSDSEQIFKSHINELSITSHSSENPIYFLQSSFGPNLPGPPLNYLENEIIVANPLDACSTLSNSSKVQGKILLVEDGSLDGNECDYLKKVLEGQSAGAIAVVVYNKDTGESNWSDDLKTMSASSGDIGSVTTPSIFIRASDGKKIKEFIEEDVTTVQITKKTNVEISGLTIVPGMFFINDVVVRNNNGNSEVYVAAGSRLWNRVLGAGKDTNTVYGSGHDAIYKSVDGGINWSKIELYVPVDADNNIHNLAVVPMDLELDNDNRLWASSTISPQYKLVGDQWSGNPPKGGGKIYRFNEDGDSATLIHEIKVERNTATHEIFRTLKADEEVA